MQKIWSISGRSIAVSTLALALAACQSMRGPEPVVNADIPMNYSSNTAGPSIAEQGYKDFFSDPRLIQVIDLSLKNNRDLRVAALNVQKVQEQYQIAVNNQLPTIGSDAGFTRSATPNTGYSPRNAYTIGLGVTSYEIDFWGRLRSLKDAALDNYFATQSARDASQISLISQVAEAWLSYSFATAQLKLAEQTLQSQLDAYNLNKKRFDVGIDNEVSVRQAQITVETARNDVANYKTQIAQAKNALNLLVGQPVTDDLLPTQPVSTITKTTVFSTGLSSDLLANRPDIKQAEFQLSSAGANIGAAKALLYPNISLSSSAGFASADLSDLFKSGAFVWSVAPSLSLPIFDWGTRQANIKISKTDQQIALANYEQAIQSAFKEVNDALATRANIGDRLSAQTRLIEASEATYRLSNARFRAGIENYLNVLDAQRSTYSAQQGLLLLEQTNLNNQIELYKTLGGGLKTNTTDRVVRPLSSASVKQHVVVEKTNLTKE